MRRAYPPAPDKNLQPQPTTGAEKAPATGEAAAEGRPVVAGEEQGAAAPEPPPPVKPVVKYSREERMLDACNLVATHFPRQSNHDKDSNDDNDKVDNVDKVDTDEKIDGSKSNASTLLARFWSARLAPRAEWETHDAEFSGNSQ
jgi:hypothetical protein